MNIHIFFQMNRESSAGSEEKKIRIDRSLELNKIFNYGRDTNGVKYGKCIECLKSTGFEKIINMKDSNTSGTKAHLRSHHRDLFKKIFSEPSLSNTQVMNLLFYFILY